MRTQVLALFLFVYVGFSIVSAGRWSKWYPLTTCSAKPCKCAINEADKCETGTKVMIRSCIYSKNDMSVCEYKDGIGPMEVRHCKNKEVCPGWSDLKPIGQCNCSSKKQGHVRLCNNPSPIHPDVLCLNEYTGVGAEEYRIYKDCECTEEEREKWYTTTTVGTTTTTTSEPTTELPWCCEQEIESYDFDEKLDQKTSATLPTTKKLTDVEVAYYEYYDSLVNTYKNQNCIECTQENGYNTTSPVYNYDDNSEDAGNSNVFGK